MNTTAKRSAKSNAQRESLPPITLSEVMMTLFYGAPKDPALKTKRPEHASPAPKRATKTRITK